MWGSWRRSNKYQVTSSKECWVRSVPRYIAVYSLLDLQGGKGMPIIKYKDYEISPASEYLVESGKWSLRVSIVKHRDSHGVTNQQFFSGRNTFSTREEADTHCIEFGKMIIDGQQPGLSVEDL